MSAYLLMNGIDEILIAAYLGVSSIAGMVPTFFTATLFRNYGIEKIGGCSLAVVVILYFVLRSFFFRLICHLVSGFMFGSMRWFFLSPLWEQLTKQAQQQPTQLGESLG